MTHGAPHALVGAGACTRYTNCTLLAEVHTCHKIYLGSARGIDALLYQLWRLRVNCYLFSRFLTPNGRRRDGALSLRLSANVQTGSNVPF